MKSSVVLSHTAKEEGSIEVNCIIGLKSRRSGCRCVENIGYEVDVLSK